MRKEFVTILRKNIGVSEVVQKFDIDNIVLNKSSEIT